MFSNCYSRPCQLQKPRIHMWQVVRQLRLKALPDKVSKAIASGKRKVEEGSSWQDEVSKNSKRDTSAGLPGACN